MFSPYLFGPSISGKESEMFEQRASLIKYLQQTKAAGCQAVELSLVQGERVAASNHPEVFELVRQFEFRSIHLPVKLNGEWFRYPSAAWEALRADLHEIITAIDPAVVVIHPDLVDDYVVLQAEYGSLLAFENMDAQKSFGSTVTDMQLVFEKAPQAKWVCDVNHIYTTDQSVKETAQAFHTAFASRLSHYHVSGFGGFHDALCLSHEDVILTGILDATKPLIDEGDILPKNVLEKEKEYIFQRLK